MATQFLLSIVFLMVFITSCFASAFTEKPAVKEFIQMMHTQYHFDTTFLNDLFASVKVRPLILKKIKYPIEKKPWNIYQLLFITDKQIKQGVEFWNQYQDVLAQTEKQYGIPASIIVATIGIETKYGTRIGSYPVIDALTNMAFSDSPRANYFKKELIEFLLLTREQHLDPKVVMGSYAGAIGQPQFMPSSYRYYAVSFKGDKKIDLSHNEKDVISSIANYYHKNGWQRTQPVAVPFSWFGNPFQINWTHTQKISRLDLVQHGFISTEQLLNLSPKNFLVLESNFGNEYWHCFHNFYVIKKYNHSDLYAMAIYQLSYYLTLNMRPHDF